MGEGKIIFGGVVSVVAGIVYIVHYQQSRDRREMHKGVERDKERLKLKKQISSEK